MSNQSDGRIKLTILGGFLGSGKSTWLRHQLFAKSIHASQIIVNEVATSAVDDILLHGAEKLHVIAGGCACCEQIVEMKELLSAICNEQTKQQFVTTAPSQHIVFEMSGVANPANVLQVLQDDPVLSRHILLDKIIVIVDGLHGLNQLQGEELSRHQVETADQLIVTKTEECDPNELAILIATLNQLNATQNICAASFGVQTELPNLPFAQPFPLADIHEGNRGELSSVEIDLKLYGDEEFGWANFTVWLSAILHAHGDHIVRVKGVVRTPAGRLLLQSVRKVMQSPEILPLLSEDSQTVGKTKDDVVVLIGRGIDMHQIQDSLRSFMV